MRQITVAAAHGSAQEIAEIAFAVGISEVTIGEKRVFGAHGSEVVKDSIEMEIGTPLAKAFLDEFTSKRFFTGNCKQLPLQVVELGRQSVRAEVADRGVSPRV